MEKIKLQITGNGMDFEGISRYDGKVYFVENAVEGDVLFVTELKNNKNFVKAKIENVEVYSAHRCNPKCKHFEVCGGCNAQHISYDKQLQIKTQNVQNLFDKQKLDVCVLKCKKSEQDYAYRNKLTMYLTKNNNLGFFAKKSKQLVDISRCELVDEKFNFLISKLNLFLKNNKEFSPLVLKGVAIRQINNNLFILNFILNKKINFIKLENYLKLNKINYSIFYCINNNNNLPTSPCYFVGGEQNLNIVENNIKYEIHPLSFLQVNNCVKTQIYNHILSLINDDEYVLDAYSGAGLLSALISKKSKKVFAIEIEESASNACKKLCKTNNINNLVSICGDCGEEVPKILESNFIDTVVLDPARKGADENTLNSIVKAKPKQIIYLSCNPATLTRDLKFLCLNGNYQIKFVQPYDMFPNTSEVETLVLLKK